MWSTWAKICREWIYVFTSPTFKSYAVYFIFTFLKTFSYIWIFSLFVKTFIITKYQFDQQFWPLKLLLSTCFVVLQLSIRHIIFPELFPQCTIYWLPWNDLSLEDFLKPLQKSQIQSLQIEIVNIKNLRNMNRNFYRSMPISAFDHNWSELILWKVLSRFETLYNAPKIYIFDFSTPPDYKLRLSTV